MTHPYLELMRRYVEDYTNGHDPSVIPDIIDPSYRFTMGGVTMGYEEYVDMVEGAFDVFPDLQLVVHDIFTDGERLAMHFSEHATSIRHGGNRAVWQGISMYRWNGDRLTECKVEQDFYGRRRQLTSGVPDGMESPMKDPWSTQPAESNAELERTVRELAAEPPPDLPLEPETVDIEAAFTAGTRAAIRSRWTGVYRGGLEAGEPVGSGAHVHTMTVVDTADVMTIYTLIDLHGLRRRLSAS